jgi:hypothetical protein
MAAEPKGATLTAINTPVGPADGMGEKINFFHVTDE